MKRFLFPIALVAVAAMSYSCAKTESTPAQEGQTLTFRIVREGAAADDASKALISETDDGRYVTFESGDKAGVIQVSGETATGTYGTITPDGTEATTQIYVKSSLAAETVLYFYYPYASTQTAYSAVPLNIPTYQSANTAGYDADAMPMVAPSLTLEEALTASTDTTIKYYNLGSLIKFKVYSTNEDYLAESVKSVKFAAADGIAGDFTYNLSTVDGSTFTTPTLSETEIETAFDEVSSLSEASSKDNAVVLYMVLGAGSHSGTFTVTTDQAVYTYELSSAKTFQRSKCKNVSFDLANGARTAQKLADYKTVTELPYTNALTSDDGYFKVEDVTKDSNVSDVWTFTSSYGAKATAYVSNTNYAADSYLVSPIFSLSDVSNVQLTFEHAGKFFATPLSSYAKLWVRTVKDGEYGDWTELTIDTYFGNSSWDYVSNTVDLSDYVSSDFQLAFEYISTSSKAGTWEIKNFNLAAFTPSPEIVSVDPTEISYSADEEAGTEKTITVTTKNATSVSATVSDEDNFSVSVSDLADGVATVTVTNLNAAAESTVEATISITATDGTTTTNATTVAVSQAGSSVTYVTYTKITSTNDLTSGAKYLIVYEDGPLAFDGSLSADAKSNYKSVTISNSSISVAESDDTFYFTITASGTNYTVKAKSGSCIGNTSDANALNYGSSYTNTISFNDDGTVNIVNGGGSYLRYNATSGQTRFRYYKSSTYTGQKAIQLYKVSE